MVGLITDDTPIAETPHATTIERTNWPPWGKAFIAALRTAPNVTRAAKAAGIDRGTAYDLAKRDPTFDAAVRAAKEEALDFLEEVIWASATRGIPTTKTVTKKAADGKVIEETTTQEAHRNPVEAMFVLKRWRPEYRESFVVEQSGPGGGPVQHEVSIVDDAVAEFRAKLERAGADVVERAD